MLPHYKQGVNAVLQPKRGISKTSKDKKKYLALKGLNKISRDKCKMTVKLMHVSFFFYYFQNSKKSVK